MQYGARQHAARSSASLTPLLHCYRASRSAGLSDKAIQRKATCRALFSKLLYLVEEPRILEPSADLTVSTMKQVRAKHACCACRHLMFCGLCRSAP